MARKSADSVFIQLVIGLATGVQGQEPNARLNLQNAETGINTKNTTKHTEKKNHV